MKSFLYYSNCIVDVHDCIHFQNYLKTGAKVFNGDVFLSSIYHTHVLYFGLNF